MRLILSEQRRQLLLLLAERVVRLVHARDHGLEAGSMRDGVVQNRNQVDSTFQAGSIQTSAHRSVVADVCKKGLRTVPASQPFPLLSIIQS